MKRFWDDVTVAEADQGLAILLDGRPVRLPGGAPIHARTRPLAEAVAEEWRSAGGKKGGDFSMEHIPLTRLVGTAAERIAPDPTAMVEGLAAYGGTDLLCYRAEDRKLAAIQAAEWDPWLEWSAQVLDAPLLTGTGILHVTQPESSRAALARAVAARAPEELAAMGVLVPALGSLVLTLALTHGALDAAEAHRISLVDEHFQEEFWGLDAETAARRQRIAAEVAEAARLLELVRP
ncbi:ATP12 family chaperone protein [Rhodovarius lipocyclicus]|uniref:ATP12 family chaperone protein n=1 Tax=Rhodovarius lipocyclicus TaxID=268410 RepID=UPI001356CB87|nr:ATP12 family protein [Rhodovarius lipocyclicus]